MNTLFASIYAVTLKTDNNRVLSYTTTRKGAEARQGAWERFYNSENLEILKFDVWREKPAIEYTEQIKRESI